MWSNGAETATQVLATACAVCSFLGLIIFTGHWLFNRRIPQRGGARTTVRHSDEGLIAFRKGNYARAERHFEDVLEWIARNGETFSELEMLTWAQLAMVAIEQQHWETAASRAYKALRLLESRPRSKHARFVCRQAARALESMVHEDRCQKHESPGG